MAKLRVPTDADVEVLQGIVERERRRPPPPPRSTVDLEREHQAPETYICRTPSDGVPELTGDEPGVAELPVYRVLRDNDARPYLSPVQGLTRVVFNLSTEAVGGNRWVGISRDKFGSWLLGGGAGGLFPFPTETDETPGTGTGTGSQGVDTFLGGLCGLASLRDNDCVLVSGPYNAVFLSRTGTASVWSGDTPLSHPAGSGLVEFWFEAGTAHLSVGGLELLSCGDGCFAGGPLTGHGDEGTGTPAPEACAGTAWRACVACVACPTTVTGTGPDFWTGTGVFDLPACSDLETFDVVGLWINGPQCLKDMGAFALPWNGSNWQSGAFQPCTMATSNPLILTCTGGSSWSLSPTTTGTTVCFEVGEPPWSPYAGNSDPLAPELRFLVDVNASCGGPAKAELMLIKAP